MLLVAPVAFVVSAAWETFALRHVAPAVRLLLVGTSGTTAETLLRDIRQGRAGGYELIGVVCPEEAPGEVADQVRVLGRVDELDRVIAEHRPDLVVSAGFMKIVGPAVLGRFEGRLLNTHPALLPAFPGAHAVRDALASGVAVTGATVHLVDAGVDTGPVLAQREVTVRPDDDEGALHERIKIVERQLLVDTVAELATTDPTRRGRAPR